MTIANDSGLEVIRKAVVVEGDGSYSLQVRETSSQAVTGPLTDTQLRATSVPVSGTFYPATQPISAVSLPLPASAATDAKQDTGNTSLGSIDTKLTAIQRTSTATLSNVASSATNVTLLASNSSRKMATFFNDSTANCFLKFGTTSSSTSYTIKIAAAGYYELPAPAYTGQIDGIWDSANGSMRVTEL